jgi:hypothetical protein
MSKTPLTKNQRKNVWVHVIAIMAVNSVYGSGKQCVGVQICTYGLSCDRTCVYKRPKVDRLDHVCTKLYNFTVHA